MKFLNKIGKYNSNICLIDENGKTFSYKDVLNIAKKNSKNLKRRRLIFVLAQNDIEFITSYIGFLAKDLVLMLINPKIEIDQLKNLVLYYFPSYTWI